MNPAFDKVIKAVTPPGAIVDNASWSTTEIDTAGYAYAEFIIQFGAMDIAMAALKLQESDTSGAGMTDVTGAVFGTSNNDTGSASTLPSATADNTIFSIGVDLRGGRKRFLDLVATGGDGTAGTYMSAICILYKSADGPRTAVEAGFSQRLLV